MKLLYVIAIFVAVWLTMISAAPINGRYRRGARRGPKSSVTKRPADTTTRKATTRRTTTRKATATTKATTTIKAPAPTIVIKETTTTKAPAPTTPSSSSSSTYSGDGTYYDVGVGSCGVSNSNTEMVAALNAPQMQNGANPNNNPQCGKSIKVTNPANNKSVVVKIVDTCPPCASGSVDLSPSAFASIADMSLGRIKINWSYV